MPDFNRTAPTPVASVTQSYMVDKYRLVVGAQFVMRAYDDGTGGFVYWETSNTARTPLSSDTSPSYTGTLTATAIIGPR